MSQHFQHFLRKWYLTPRGQMLFKQESRLVDDAICNLFGYYLVQLGCSASCSWVERSRVSNKIILDAHLDAELVSRWRAELSQSSQKKSMVYWAKTDLNYLPLRKDSVDVMLLPHTLETVRDPYYLLRQVDTHLVAEGHVVLTGFNPLACATLKSKLGKEGAHFRDAKLVNSGRVVEWLQVLGYEIEQVTFSTISCFSGTTERETMTGWRLLERTEKLLSRIGFRFGNVYCIVARKRVDSPKMVGATWQKTPWLNPLTKGNQVVSSQTSKKLNQPTPQGQSLDKEGKKEVPCRS